MVTELLKKSFDVTVYDLFIYGNHLPKNKKNLKIEIVDVRNLEKLQKVIKNQDVVIHLAAKVGGIMDNINHPVTHLDDNLLMNTLVLKYAHKYKVSRFISILSCTMYAKEYSGLPFKEES